MSIREALIHMFTDDPVNWLKWALVFAVLIGGYFVAIPLYGRLSHGMSWERKRDIARSRNHIIKASIVKKWPSGDVGHYNWHATYRYALQGEERSYTAYFKHPSTPPLYLYLYYIKQGTASSAGHLPALDFGSGRLCPFGCGAAAGNLREGTAAGRHEV